MQHVCITIFQLSFELSLLIDIDIKHICMMMAGSIGSPIFCIGSPQNICLQTRSFAPIWPEIELRFEAFQMTGHSSAHKLVLLNKSELAERNLISNGNSTVYVGMWLKLNSVSSKSPAAWLCIFVRIVGSLDLQWLFIRWAAAMKLLQQNWCKRKLIPLPCSGQCLNPNLKSK